jgi:hypothetical protein
MTETLLSRSGSSSPSGKLDRRLDVPVSEEIENAVIAIATLIGIPKADFVRLLLEKALFGEFSMMQKIANRSE